jgi:hypothetical protein
MADREKVVFRYWQGDIIALFPELASDPNPYFCESYQHVGQHASADPFLLIRASRPATLTEYRPLLRELQSRGYRLDIRRRMSSDAIEIRRGQLR